jgi:DNA-directed RNA polymerase subunit RPC12/RpoP
MASRRRKATGEMGYHDIQPGGEHYEWAKMIESAAKQLQRRTGNKIRFQGMRPFDVYQGPYASMNYGKLWSGEKDGEFYYDGIVKVSGDIDDITEAVKEKIHGMKASDHSNLRSRRAMYWGAPDRIYRLTKNEQENGMAVCPRCRAEMQKEPFTKSEKLYTCPSCGFKVPSSKTTTTKIEIEVEDGEVTDVDVTTAKKDKKSSLANL